MSARSTTAVGEGPRPDPFDVQPLEPGDQLADAYRISERLAAGSMGVVYRARDERLDREVAIKIMHPDKFGMESFRVQFEAEARALARVRHPNVVEVYAFGYLGKAPYFVMEYVDGVNLGDWRATRSAPVSLDEALGILDPLCRGVQAVHQAGAVHRDIKPGNVLVGPAFRVALVDLGLVRPLENLRIAGSRMLAGTPAYMAPEVILGSDPAPRLAPRIDVYALGVVVFELLTGAWPVDGDSPQAILEAQLERTPRRVRELRPDLPRAVDDVLAAALRKDASERIGSAEALRRALHRARQSAADDTGELELLVVDEDDCHRRLLASWLRHTCARASVHEAVDGPDGLAQLLRRDGTLDLAIVDLHARGARELVAALNLHAFDPRVDTIVISAVGRVPDWDELDRLGAAAFLVKPVDPDQLLGAEPV